MAFYKYILSIIGWNYRNKIEILRDFGADIIQLKCPVIDRETNELLRKAGAQMLDQSCQVQ